MKQREDENPSRRCRPRWIIGLPKRPESGYSVLIWRESGPVRLRREYLERVD